MSTPSKGAKGVGAPPSSTLGGTPAKKGGKKRSPKTPLCSQRRFLLLFFAQAFLVCMYLTPPHLVTTKSSREAAAAAQLRGATSGGADVAKKGIVADVAGSTVEDPEVQLQRRRRGTWRKLRGGIRKRPPGTKPATSAGTTKPSLASVNTTTAKSPRAAQDLSGNATSTTSSTGTTEGDPIPEDLATTSQPLARKPGISLNGSSDAASAHSTGLDSTVGNRIGGAGAEAEGGASAGAGEGGALRLTGEQAQFGKQRQGRAMQNVQEHQREDSSADTSRSGSSIGGTPSSLPLRAVHRQATRGVRQFHLKGEDLEEQRRGAQGSAQARDVFALQSSSHLKAGSLLHEQTQGDTHELGRKALTQQVEDTAEGTGHHATQGSTQASGSHSTAQLARRRLTHWVSSSSPPQPWPPQNPISLRFKALNQQPPRNREAHPVLAADKVVLVLYVHKRAGYLQRALEGLAKMEGVNETLLIVSHDGQYPEVEALVQGITFCQVKQIHAPYSPHIFRSSFPGPSPEDCRGYAAPNAAPSGCWGQADHYGNFREPNKTAIKHHWWWLMNTVWDGLEETRGFDGHMLFLEEDVLVAPVAYQHIKALVRAKNERCPACVAASLAPSRAHFLGDFTMRSFVIDAMGNVGYAFNRSIWERIHARGEAFCSFDDYNWDSSLSHAVFNSWPSAAALRWSRASAIHIGACGAHVNLSGKDEDCSDAIPAEALQGLRGYSFHIPTGAEQERDLPVASFHPNRTVAAFTGWGGWGDYRDQGLCEIFASRPGHTPSNAGLTAVQ